MNVKEYIASGILELYVAGSLTEEQNLEVAAMAANHPEVAQEIDRIEKAVVALTAMAAPPNKSSLPKVFSESKKVRRLWPTYSGWAAAAVVGVGLLYFFNQNSSLKTQLTEAADRQQLIETELQETSEALYASQEVLDNLRDKDVDKIQLPGQGSFNQAYAAVYWNKKEQKVYVDINGLPKAPAGMQYQLWSLKLDPLTPTSLGVFASSDGDLNVYAFNNANQSEAFGITLEPEGGSETPNLEQLYVLGAAATP